MERRLAAILAADVVGYTSLVERDESDTIARLRTLRVQHLEPEIARWHGRVFKLTGDGLFAEFRSVIDAIECAVEVQRLLAAQQECLAPERMIRLRIGVELGDVIVEDADLLGEGVNTAARLQELAEPGEIIVSAKVARESSGRISVGLEAQGERRLKNVSEPAAVFRVAPAHTGLVAPAAPPLPAKPSIAVMPFDNLGGGDEQDYFADGLVEEIITSLSKNPALFVIGRNSTFAFRGQFPGAREVGRRLGVRYILQGSLRRSANRPRISGQLIEAVSETCVWAERFDGILEDVFELQDQLTMSIVGALEPSLRRVEIERARRKRVENLDAYDLYLRALPHVYANTMTDVDEALRLLELSLRLDPDNARARANAAWCGEQRYFRGGFRPEDREMALAHCRAALTLGGADAQALATAGFVLGNLTHDFDAAMHAIDRALAQSGECALAYGFSALVSTFIAQPARAVDHARRALRLSPIDPLNYHALLALASLALFEGRPLEAVSHLNAAIELAPRFSVLHAILTASLAAAGDMTAAREAAGTLLVVAPDFSVSGFVAMGVYRPAQMAIIAEGLRKAGVA